MVWVPTEGQGRDGIPHSKPKEQAAAELPRNRSHCCPFGRSRPAGGPGLLGEAPGQDRGEKELPGWATLRAVWLVVSEQQLQVREQSQEAAPGPVLRTLLRIMGHPAWVLQCEVHGHKGCGRRKAGCLNTVCQRWESPPQARPGPVGCHPESRCSRGDRDSSHFPVQLGWDLAAFLDDWLPMTQEGAHL